MTKNNLRGHLNWLVSSNSFAPPTPGPTPPDIVASTSFISASEDPLHNHQSGGFDVSIYRQSDRDDVEEPFSQLVPLRHPDNSLSAPDTNAMARLQAGSSTRSKLLSHDVSGQLQTPTSHHSRPPSTSLRDQYTAPYEKGASESTSIDIVLGLQLTACSHSVHGQEKPKRQASTANASSVNKHKSPVQNRNKCA